jgi:prepilin-type N-terminal cleavage/methylation domain-containing protein
MHAIAPHTDSRPTGKPEDTGPILLGNRGFTLIEMIVVTALISIMLVVAIPRLEGGLFSDGSDETARWIIANVRQLKGKGGCRTQNLLLNVSPDVQRLWITEAGMADADADAAREAGYALPRGVNIDHVAFSQTERFSSGTIPIGFYPKGLFRQSRHPHANQ